jgi:hypothetical protein
MSLTPLLVFHNELGAIEPPSGAPLRDAYRVNAIVSQNFTKIPKLGKFILKSFNSDAII